MIIVLLLIIFYCIFFTSLSDAIRKNNANVTDRKFNGALSDVLKRMPQVVKRCHERSVSRINPEYTTRVKKHHQRTKPFKCEFWKFRQRVR